MKSLLSKFVDDLDLALVDKELLKTIDAGIADFPLLSGGMLECRLSPKEAAVDFSLRVQAQEKSQLETKITAVAYNHPGLQAILNQWINPESNFLSFIEIIWLEYDMVLRLEDVDFSLSAPSIFFDIRKMWDLTNRRPQQAEHLKSVLSFIFRKLDQPFSYTLLSKAIECVLILPLHAYVRQIGAMISRKTDKIRFCIHGLNFSQIENYLNQIGWVGDISELKKIITSIADILEYCVLDIDVGEQIESTMGIECYVISGPHQIFNWNLFLECLVKHGLCTEEKKQGLTKWQGYAFHNENVDGSSHRYALVRRINHIKIVYSPQLPLRAKAYLYFGYSPIRQNGLLVLHQSNIC